MASQKLGTATPNEESVMIKWSSREPGRVAAAMPSGMPISSDKSNDPATMSSVFGNRCRIESRTGSPESSDFARSPCTA